MLLNSFLVILLLQFIFVYSADNCFTVPVSLSSLTNCENKDCLFSQYATLALPAPAGTKACVKFVSPDGLAPATSLDLHLARADYSNPLTFSDFTDSVASHVSGFCGCPGGTTVSCSSNNLRSIYPDAHQCIDGLHNDNYCALTAWFGTSGTWVAELDMAIRARFKVMQLGTKPNKLVDLVMDTNNGSWAMSYDGAVVKNTQSGSFNVTVISDTFAYNRPGDYIVFDLVSQTDFWILPEAYVNGPNSYDYGKLAWNKFNKSTKVSPNLLRDMNVRISDCEKNQFSFVAPWLNTVTFLQSSSQYLSSRISPNSDLEDPDWEPDQPITKGTPDLTFEPYSYMANGAIFVSIDAGPSFIGVNDMGRLVPLPAVGYSTKNFCNLWSGFAINTNVEAVTLLNEQLLILASNCSDYFYYPTASINYDSAFFFTWSGRNSSQQGFGYYGGSSDNNIYLVNWTISIVSWPSFSNAKLSYQDGLITETLLPIDTSGSSYYIEPITRGVLTVGIQFTNLSISFQSTVIQPDLSSVAFESPNIIISASSLTVPGDCYVSTVPAGVITTQVIRLQIASQIYKYPVAVSYVNGNVTVLLTCYENSDSGIVAFTFGQPVDTLVLSGNETKAYIPPFSWSPNFSGLKSTKTWWDNMWDFSDWLDYLKVAGFIIGIIIVTPIVLWVLYHIVYLMIKLSNRRSKRGYIEYDILSSKSKAI